MNTTTEHTTIPPRAEERPAHVTRQPIGVLLTRLWRDTTLLARGEADLARAEISEKADQAISGVGMIAAGGAVIFSGFLILLLAASNALVPMLPPDLAPWLAPLIVGAAVMVIGFVALAGGRSELKGKNLAPTRTLRSLRRDGRLVKEHMQ